jgi:hypothetical protein
MLHVNSEKEVRAQRGEENWSEEATALKNDMRIVFAVDPARMTIADDQ